MNFANAMTDRAVREDQHFCPRFSGSGTMPCRDHRQHSTLPRVVCLSHCIQNCGRKSLGL